MPEPRVRSHQREEIRIAGNDGAEIALRPAFPLLVQTPTANAVNFDTGDQIHRFETGGEDNHVRCALNALAVEDASFGNPRCRMRDQRNVRPRQRRIEIIRDQHTLAAQLVGGRDLVAQRRISDLRFDVTAREFLGETRLGARARFQKRRYARFVHEIKEYPLQLLQQRCAAKQRALFLRHGAIILRHDPIRCALVEIEVRHDRRNLRRYLNCASARTDHRHAFAGEIDIAAPLCTVPARPLERRHARNIWHVRHVQAAHAGNQRPRRQLLAVAGFEPPELRRIIPRRTRKL